MKTSIQYLAVIMSAFLMLTGAAMAQNSTNSTEDEFSSNNTSEDASQLGEGVRAYNFNIQGLPAQAALEGPVNSADQEDDSEAERTDEPVVRLSGFVEFNTGGYEVDVETEEENNTVDFTVTIEEPEESATQAITRAPVEENFEAEPGNYTANLEVVRNDETVLERTEEVTVPESNEESERFEQDPENMTREELIEEVRDLRERVSELTEDAEESGEEREGPPEDIPANPGQEDEDEESNESEESESENESQEGPPSETPGQGNSNRPGFVNNLLRGIFG
jgi:hypothetical protein